MKEPSSKRYTDQELLDMRPEPGSDHEAWRDWHRILYEHGKLTPPQSAE